MHNMSTARSSFRSLPFPLARVVIISGAINFVGFALAGLGSAATPTAYPGAAAFRSPPFDSDRWEFRTTRLESAGPSPRAIRPTTDTAYIYNSGFIVDSTDNPGGQTSITTGDTLTVTSGGFAVGVNHSGTFTQSGGSAVVNGNYLYLGLMFGSTGVYNMSGGDLTADQVIVGYGGTGTFTQSGGTVTTGNNGFLRLGNNPGSTGTYNLDGGTLTTSFVGVASSTNNNAFNFNGGTLQLQANNGSFSGGPFLTANVRAGGAIIDTAGFNVTVSAPLVHSTITGDAATDGGLTKNGLGTLTLFGASTYNGGTTLNAGTLLVNNTTGSGTGTGAVTVKTNTTLGGSGTIAGAVTVNSGGKLAPGNSAGRLSVGSLTLASGSTLAIELGGTTAGSQYDQVFVAGALSLTGSTLSVSQINGFNLAPGQKFFILDRTGTDVSPVGLFANAPGGIYTDTAGNKFLVNYADHDPADTSNALLNDVSLTVTPEPSTWAMLLLGGAGLLALPVVRRRRRRQSGAAA